MYVVSPGNAKGIFTHKTLVYVHSTETVLYHPHVRMHVCTPLLLHSPTMPSFAKCGSLCSSLLRVNTNLQAFCKLLPATFICMYVRTAACMDNCHLCLSHSLPCSLTYTLLLLHTLPSLLHSLLSPPHSDLSLSTHSHCLPPILSTFNLPPLPTTYTSCQYNSPQRGSWLP